MSASREEFCRELLDDYPAHGKMHPEGVAARFVSYFGVKGRPTMTARIKAAAAGPQDSARALADTAREWGWPATWCAPEQN